MPRLRMYGSVPSLSHTSWRGAVFKTEIIVFQKKEILSEGEKSKLEGEETE
jgi:hypothetical protein